MPVQIKKGFRQMLGEAADNVEEVPVSAVARVVGDPEVAVIDVRDRHELVNTGTLPGAHHASRGMLEFYADPESPMHRPVFSEAKQLILYCGTSGRSALAAHTLAQMGFDNVAHMAGGFKAWAEAGNPVSAFPAEGEDSAK